MIDSFTLTQIVQQAAEAGVANYMKLVQPTSDALKKREAYRWFKSMGLRQSLLDELIESGKITQTRMGTGKNSPLMVSRSEIINALTAIKIGKFLNN